MRNGEVTSLAQTIWDYHHLGMPLEKADCIVGLGSYDIRVAERCADLYRKNFAPFIIFSGYLGNWTRGMWDKSEAKIFAERAIEKGVPKNKIKLEDKSTNIGENIAFTRKFLETQNIRPSAVIIVTKPSAERRVFATCKKIWPDIQVCITSPQLNFSEQRQNNILPDNLIHEMVGDIQRLKIYPDLGYQIGQVIPDDVWQAYERLVYLGYDHHLIPSI